MAENALKNKPRKIYVRVKKLSEYVQIEIEDTGKGMSQETRNHIFEPFYTTRKTGNGLGLSISSYIINENHHGAMMVESEPGKGTKFIISLPYIQRYDKAKDEMIYAG